MPNRYANLIPTKKISEDFVNITLGFDKVQADVDEIVADLATEEATRLANDNAHLASTTAHNATAIVFTPGDSNLAALSVDGAIKELDTLVDAIQTGDSGPAANAARVSTPYCIIFDTLKDRVDNTDAVAIALQAETVTGVINLKHLPTPYVSAVGDGVTDDTVAFHNAGLLAISLRCALIVPWGRYLITDELVFSEGFAIQGTGLDQGDGGSATAKGSIILFNNSAVDGSLNATKCCMRFLKATTYRLNNMRIENIGIVHTSTVKNQHSIIIDGAEFSYSKLKNMSFLDVTGYAIQFSGTTYSQNLNWENLSFVRVGGCIGRSSSASALTVTMARFANFNLEVVNSISAQAVLYDFSGMRHYSADTILCEGLMTGVVTDVVGLKMGTTYGNSTNTFRNVWFEFSGIKQLTYTIETIQGGYFEMESVYGVTSTSPIKLGGNHTTLVIRGMDAYGQVPNSMVTYQSTTAKIVFEGLIFDHIQPVPSSKIGVLELKNCISSLGGEKTRFSQASDCVLYQYNGGFIESNKFVTVPKKGAFHITDVYIDSDATEGRFLVYKNTTTNELPNVYIYIYS